MNIRFRRVQFVGAMVKTRLTPTRQPDQMIQAVKPVPATRMAPRQDRAGRAPASRPRARLTQEELAEAAGLSPRLVSDLERGINLTARKDTSGLLAGALGLAQQVPAVFVAVARGRAPAAEVLTAMRREATVAVSGGAMSSWR